MTAARTLQAVLIDLDGTLIDPGRGVGAAVRAATDALDLPAPTSALLRRFVGPPIQQGFAELLGLEALQTAAAITAFRRDYAAGGLYDFDVYPASPRCSRSSPRTGSDSSSRRASPNISPSTSCGTLS